MACGGLGAVQCWSQQCKDADQGGTGCMFFLEHIPAVPVEYYGTFNPPPSNSENNSIMKLQQRHGK